MAISIRPADPGRQPGFFGEVIGIDIRQPLSAAVIAQVDEAMDRYAVLVFRDQDIDDEQQLAFTRNFGTLEMATGDISSQGKPRRLRAEINDISNLDEHNQRMDLHDRRRLILLTNRNWHSDSSYKATPAKYSLLAARVVPTVRADTQFADMRAAYDALDPVLKTTIHDLVCEHSQFFSRSMLGFTEADFSEHEKRHFHPVPQRLVRRHPGTGRLSLYLSGHAGSIVGWPTPEARVLLRELNEHATQREFVHSHVWRPHDLVMWDNRVTMHRSTRYDGTEVRDLRRTTVCDVAPTLEQAL